MKVLLADKHGIVRQGVRCLLERAPDIVVTGEVSDGFSLLAMAREHQPDVIVTEVHLPVVGGLEAARVIRAENLPSQILFLTSTSDRDTVSAAFAAGAKGYVLKDAEFAFLLDGIRSVKAQETYVGPKVLDVFFEHDVSVPCPEGQLEKLTAREQEILRLVADGKTSKDIAFILGISNKTVDTFRRHCMKKLKLKTSADLTRYAIRNGMIPL